MQRLPNFSMGDEQSTITHTIPINSLKGVCITVTTASRVLQELWLFVPHKTYLHEDREKDDCDDGGKEHVPHGKLIRMQEVAQGERYCPSQATVGYDELVFVGELDYAELVDHESEAHHPLREQKTGVNK